MNRRDFLKKVAQLVGTSAAGISLTKLQIATIATGLSGAAGCARNPVGDDILNGEGNATMAPCVCLHTCTEQLYGCENQVFLCIDGVFICRAPSEFLCNNDRFTCSLSFLCQDSDQQFQCEAIEFSILHQGSVTAG